MTTSISSRRALLGEAQRINAKLAAVIDGEAAYPTLLALLALAVHSAGQAPVSHEEALRIFRALLDSHNPRGQA